MTAREQLLIRLLQRFLGDHADKGRRCDCLICLDTRRIVRELRAKKK